MAENRIAELEARVAELEAEVQLYRDKSERAEQWLGKISTEIQERVLGAIIEGANRPERGLRCMSSEKAPTPAGRQEALAAKASEETRRCEAWLLRFIQSDQPKFLTKAELREPR